MASRSLSLLIQSPIMHDRNVQPLLEGWLSGNTRRAEQALDRYIEWTPAAAAALQESVLEGDLSTICTTTDSVSINFN